MLVFEKVKKDEFDIYISEIVFNEIERASENKRKKLENLIDEFTPNKLETTEEVLWIKNLMNYF